VLVAALGSYHRSAVHTDPDGEQAATPLPVRRRLRAWPWWTPAQARCRDWWHGRLVGGWGDAGCVAVPTPTPVLVDAKVRLVARRGVTLALVGDLDDDSRRSWAAAFVADQARFPSSPLAAASPQAYPAYVSGGPEGVATETVLFVNGRAWSSDEHERLATVVNGLWGGDLTIRRPDHPAHPGVVSIGCWRVGPRQCFPTHLPVRPVCGPLAAEQGLWHTVGCVTLPRCHRKTARRGLGCLDGWRRGAQRASSDRALTRRKRNGRAIPKNDANKTGAPDGPRRDPG